MDVLSRVWIYVIALVLAVWLIGAGTRGQLMSHGRGGSKVIAMVKPVWARLLFLLVGVACAGWGAWDLARKF